MHRDGRIVNLLREHEHGWTKRIDRVTSLYESPRLEADISVPDRLSGAVNDAHAVLRMRICGENSDAAGDQKRSEKNAKTMKSHAALRASTGPNGDDATQAFLGCFCWLRPCVRACSFPSDPRRVSHQHQRPSCSLRSVRAEPVRRRKLFVAERDERIRFHGATGRQPARRDGDGRQDRDTGADRDGIGGRDPVQQV